MDLPLLLAAGRIPQLWYALPLIVAVSLVYAATRHELMAPILRHAARTAVLITVFMSVALAILLYIDWRLL
jgi:hypothetical protein